MITGQVDANLDALIRLSVQSPEGDLHEVDAVIDTGYNSFLTLPIDEVIALGLIYLGRGAATLANGREEEFDVYEAAVIWDGIERAVPVDAIEGGALVGMSLLNGHDLHIRVEVGGQVAIKPFFPTLFNP